MFEQVEHGKSRISAIRSAIHIADEKHDRMYQLAFYLDLCHESCFYDFILIEPRILHLNLIRGMERIISKENWKVRENKSLLGM